MTIFQGASNIITKNTTFNNIAGNATFVQFYSDGPPTESEIQLFQKHMAGLLSLPDIHEIIERPALNQSISNLPRANAAWDDYVAKDKRRTTCFEGTRQALLLDIGKWIFLPEGPRIYVLFGLAGIGKSTIAQTVAKKLSGIHSLGASFFFSRDQADCKNAQKFVTTIAFQLCVFDKDFANAIGTTLLTQQGFAAITKGPEEQLKVLILGPLRGLVQRRSRPVVIVIDALDECDNEDGPVVFGLLKQLVQNMSFFRVILTTRPRPHLQHLLHGPDVSKVFHLQNIEEKVVDSDIRLYLKHSLSEEQVTAHIPAVKGQWRACDDDIESLVRAAGRLFIVASTAVFFILDKAARNPESQMRKLRTAFGENRAPFNILNDFYAVILRTAVPKECDNDIVERYQAVLGTIVFIQNPLPIQALANLTGLSSIELCAVLDNLAPVFLLSGEGQTPFIYHKSFPDYITDETRCKDNDLLLVPGVHHTRITKCCFRLMNKQLKQNMLGLGDPACFMDNKACRKTEGLDEEQLYQKLPLELRYACIYFITHFSAADVQDPSLLEEVQTFASEHILHWFEALSWIDRLDLAHSALGIMRLKLLESTALLDTCKLFYDGQRSISQYYEVIRQSALHTYYSALPFAPKGSPLYQRYQKDMMHNSCHVELIDTTPTLPKLRTTVIESLRRILLPGFLKPKESELQNYRLIPSRKDTTLDVDSIWPPMIASFGHAKSVSLVQFSSDCSQLACPAGKEMKLWDAASGTPVKTFKGDDFALNADFSTMVLRNNDTITILNVATHTPRASMTLSKVCTLAISSDGSRVAVGSLDGTVCLWTWGKEESIVTLGNYNGGELEFSRSGHRLAATRKDIKLWDCTSGKFVAELHYKRDKLGYSTFLRNGPWLVALAASGDRQRLTLWNSEDGELIDAVNDVGNRLVISADDSSFATFKTYGEGGIQLWMVDRAYLICTYTIAQKNLCGLALSQHFLVLTFFTNDPALLYDIQRRASLGLIQVHGAARVQISPDSTRLAFSIRNSGDVQLWDATNIKTSPASSVMDKSRLEVRSLAFSPDCSRLASGYTNGMIDLWDTHHPYQAITTYRDYLSRVTALAISNNECVASGYEEAIRFWEHGALAGTIILPFNGLPVLSMAHSGLLLAAGTSNMITLWNRRNKFGTLEGGGKILLFTSDGSLLVATEYYEPSIVAIWDVWKQIKVAAFHLDSAIGRLSFSPDNLRLAAQVSDGSWQLLDIVNGQTITDTGSEDFYWFRTACSGFLPSIAYDGIRHWHILLGRSPNSDICVPVVWIRKDLPIKSTRKNLPIIHGSSMLAASLEDGRILLVRSRLPPGT